MAGKKDNNLLWQLVINILPPAPDVVLHLVKCGCKEIKCSTKSYACIRAELACTDVCGCTNTDETCENCQSHQDVMSDVDDDGQKLAMLKDFRYSQANRNTTKVNRYRFAVNRILIF